MQVAKIQFTPWDRTYDFSFAGLDLNRGDKVLVKTDLGTELGTVVGFGEVDKNDIKNDVKDDELKDVEQIKGTEQAEDEEVKIDNDNKENKKREIKPVIKKVTVSDLEKLPSYNEKKEALEFCKKAKEKFDLPMKFIDVHFSFDGSRITFAFIANGRVDFRDLLKELTRHFGKTIRLQQIGIRDEAKIMGDFGPCGKRLCCKGFLKEFNSITSDMAELQQCSHRGSDRISGLCGRLMCCLAYEQNGYEELLKKMPAIGIKVNVDGKRGVVVGHNVLKQSVNVEFPGENGDDSTVAEVDLNRNKKK